MNEWKIETDGRGASKRRTLSIAKLPMKNKLPSVKDMANLDGANMRVGRPIKNARAKKSTDTSKANTKNWKRLQVDTSGHTRGRDGGGGGGGGASSGEGGEGEVGEGFQGVKVFKCMLV